MVTLIAVLILLLVLSLTGYIYWKDKPNRVGYGRTAGIVAAVLVGVLVVMVLSSTVRGCQNTRAQTVSLSYSPQ